MKKKTFESLTEIQKQKINNAKRDVRLKMNYTVRRSPIIFLVVVIFMAIALCKISGFGIFKEVIAYGIIFSFGFVCMLVPLIGKKISTYFELNSRIKNIIGVR